MDPRYQTFRIDLTVGRRRLLTVRAKQHQERGLTMKFEHASDVNLDASAMSMVIAAAEMVDPITRGRLLSVAHTLALKIEEQELPF